MLPTDVLLDWKGRVVEDLYGYRIGRIVDVQSKPETDVPEMGMHHVWQAQSPAAVRSTR
jgi:hypothetical protein